MRTMARMLASGRGTKTGALSAAGVGAEPGAEEVVPRPEQAATVTARARARVRRGIVQE